MSDVLRNRSFNVRVSFDADGNPVIGWVQGFYAVSENVVDMKKVPEDVHVMIARKLGIERCSSCVRVNRIIRGV